MGNASLQEMLWTAACLLGVGIRARPLWWAIKDNKWACQPMINGDLCLITKASLTQEAIGISVKISFAMVGIFAMLVPPNPNQEAQTYQTVFAVVLIVGILAMDYASYLTSRVRLTAMSRAGAPTRGEDEF